VSKDLFDTLRREPWVMVAYMGNSPNHVELEKASKVLGQTEVDLAAMTTTSQHDLQLNYDLLQLSAVHSTRKSVRDDCIGAMGKLEEVNPHLSSLRLWALRNR